MREPIKRQRMPVSVSLPHEMWVATSRAAGMEGMTLSEYCRAAIREKNARTFGVDEPPRLRAA
jgi:hypothetical protein